MGGHPTPPHTFILQNCVVRYTGEVRYIMGLLYLDSNVCNFALLKGKGERVKEKGKADFHLS